MPGLIVAASKTAVATYKAPQAGTGLPSTSNEPCVVITKKLTTGMRTVSKAASSVVAAVQIGQVTGMVYGKIPLYQALHHVGRRRPVRSVR